LYRQQELLDQSKRLLEEKNILVQSYLLDSHKLPVPNQQFAIVISFYSLEHLHPLDLYLSEMRRVLRPGGLFVGAIPTEGGLAWGAGRFLTSRRYIKRNSSINPDKIICWEHPNFTEDILMELDTEFDVVRKVFWPFPLPLIDLNLIVSFVYQRGMG
jgi:SAM-dependent methyltransferase